MNVYAADVVTGRMQDMAEQISRLTEEQQLYQDAISLKERELNVRMLKIYALIGSSVAQWLDNR